MDLPVLDRDLAGDTGRSLREPRQLVHPPGCKQSGAAETGRGGRATIGAWGPTVSSRRFE